MTAVEAAALGRAADAVRCDHCGLDVPSGLVRADAARQFCCSGCRTAYAIIHDHGLGAYYALSERRDAPVRASGRSYDEFDHTAFQELYVRPTADGLAEVELYLEGVHCAACVWLVERVPLIVPGVARAELNVRRSLARVAWDPSSVPLSAVARALDTLGYRAHPFRGVRAEQVRRSEDRSMLVRMGIAGAIAANVMLASAATYSGWFGGMDASTERFFRWLCLVLTAPAVLGPGMLFFRGALAAIRTRTLNMDVPIALGLGAGFVQGAVNTVAGTGPVYFDAVATLTFLLLVGRFVQQRGQRAAAAAAELMYALSPAQARVVDGDTIRDVPAEALLPEMLLDVRPGETLAADGVVERGESSLDLSLLTGESRPVGVTAGALVYAGTVNLAAPIRVRVRAAGESSRLARILRDVEEGAARRAPVVIFANRVAARFVFVVLALAAVTATVWALRDPSRAIDNAIALLVVTCPCALALATPLAVSTAIGRAARAGILVKGGSALEALARPGTLILDKTGTITQARTALAWWSGPEWVKPLVVALERESTHPIADGFRRAWTIDAPTVSSSRHVTGGGIEGTVDGRCVVVGSPAFVAARAGARPGTHAREGAPHVVGEMPASLTPVWIAVGGAVVAAAGFGDPLRPDAVAAVTTLRARGWAVSILSGDQETVVADVARALGLDPSTCVGSASPEAKLRVVTEAARRGPVVMVGDGINDAAAMAAATVGVGVHGGAEACLATADVYLSAAGLTPLCQLVDGAARTLRVIRRNIVFALGYNVVGIVLAMSGALNPLIASVLMPIASLTVVLASWRSRTFDPEVA